MDDILAAFRLIFVRHCHHCRCHAGEFCYRRMEPVKPWRTCEEWCE